MRPILLEIPILTLPMSGRQATDKPQDTDVSKTLKSDNPIAAKHPNIPANVLESIVPVSPDQVIQSGDGLYFAVSPAEELSRDIVVDQNGKISIPLIGAIQAAGLTTDELSRKIVAALSRYVSHPKVDIFLKAIAEQADRRVRQVTLPGSYPYRMNMHLLDVITLAGALFRRPTGSRSASCVESALTGA